MRKLAPGRDVATYMPDVNVYIDAWWSGSSHHDSVRRWLEGAVNGSDTVVASELIISGAVRVLSHPGIPELGIPAEEVFHRAATLLAQPGVVRARPGPRHWAIFTNLCTTTRAAGNRIPDCYHAALALESRSVFVTRDRFFSTIDELDHVDPSAGG